MLACDYALFIVYESATRKKECPVLGAFFLMCCTQSARSRLSEVSGERSA